MDCPVSGCTKRYNIRSSFTCYISRDHSNLSESDLKTSSVLSDKLTNSTSPGDHTDPVGQCEFNEWDQYIDDDDNCDVTDSVDDLSYLKEQFVTNMSLFFLMLSAQLLISNSTVELIAQELVNISALSQCYMVKSVSLLVIPWDDQ